MATPRARPGRSLAAALALAAAPLLGLGGNAAQATECIAPSAPGGGWDFTCRTIGRLLTDQGLVDGNVKVTNMPGGVGAVTFAMVANERPSDAELIVATSTVGITQIAQGRYPAPLDSMRYLAMLGADVGVIAVADDSPYQTLADLNEAIVADPASIVTAGSSSAGGWDHIRLLLVAKEAGLEDLQSLRWVQFDGGTDAVTQMLGGQINVVSTDLGEIAGFVESGDIRILAALSDDPIPAFPDIPTAKSQDIDVTGYNWRGLYTGGDVSDEAYDEWVTNLRTLYDSDGWQEAATSSGLVPIWRGGPEFEAYVREQEEQMTEISRDIGINRMTTARGDNGLANRLVAATVFLVAAAYTLVGRGYQASFGDVLGPSVFPTMVGVPAMVLSGWITLFPGGETSWPDRHRALRQVAAVVILVAYSWLLQPLGFPISTGVLIASVAWLMGGPPAKSVLLGAVAAPGLYVLFDRLLGLPLDLLGSWFA